ncbi:MAG: DinB family protein [Actinomycetales bacterium]
MTTTTAIDAGALSTERTDLLDAFSTHRHFLISTAQGLTDEQARRRTTVSELTIGGIIKHVSSMEEMWSGFVLRGPDALRREGRSFTEFTPDDWAAFAATFVLGPQESLDGVLARYAEVARATDAAISTADLDQAWKVPEAPWAPAHEQTARRTLLHLIAETAQHAGHADIIREALDGKKSMG